MTRASMNPVATSRSDGRLRLLHLPYALDGRVATHPPYARGRSIFTLALLIEQDRAILLDTGPTVHRHAVLDWLEDALPEGCDLTVLPLREGEFESVCNVIPIVDRFGASSVHAAQTGGLAWFDFLPEGSALAGLDAVDYVRVGREASFPLGPDRTLDIVQPEFRLLATHWVYDPSTRTVFTSDAFSHACPADGGAIVRTDNDDTTLAAVRDHLRDSRYWWLEGGRTAKVTAWLRSWFDAHDVDRIVPAYGAVLEGRDVVKRHLGLVCDAIAELAQMPVRPVPGAAEPPVLAYAEPQGEDALEPPGERLPRRLGPGVLWLGECLEVAYQGTTYHGYNSVFLVSGTERSVLVEAGFPGDLGLLEDELDRLLAGGLPPVEHLFTTHPEIPHAGGIGRLLRKFPDAVAIGGVQDLHLAFPDLADRIHVLAPDAAIDLGGTTFRLVPPVIRDLATTYWGYDERSRALFPGDGFAYSHYHRAGQCARLAEEATTLDLGEMTALFAELALYWTKMTDVEPHLAELDRLIDALDVRIIGPTHGLPIADVAATLPEVRRGFRVGAQR